MARAAVAQALPSESRATEGTEDAAQQRIAPAHCTPKSWQVFTRGIEMYGQRPRRSHNRKAALQAYSAARGRSTGKNATPRTKEGLDRSARRCGPKKERKQERITTGKNSRGGVAQEEHGETAKGHAEDKT